MNDKAVGKLSDKEKVKVTGYMRIIRLMGL